MIKCLNMRYIGNKINLLEFIEKPLIEKNITGTKFCDIFAGTANVGKHFKKKGYSIVSNDNMMYSYVFQKTYIENNSTPNFSGLNKIIKDVNVDTVFAYLNKLKGQKGFIYKNFCIEGSKNSKHERNYFTEENASKIDVIRDTIDDWKNKKLITENEYYILLCSIIEEIPFVSNIAGTYGAFLKIDDPRKFKTYTIKFPELISSNKTHKSYQMDANELVRKIKCDVLYIDPPYNNRQYAPNYHMWETVAVWDKQLLDRKTGLRPYKDQRSLYCSKDKCVKAFDDLIQNASCDNILFSYNTEGIIPIDQITRILSKKGKITKYARDYRRFKSNSKGKKPRESLKELLYLVEVN